MLEACETIEETDLHDHGEKSSKGKSGRARSSRKPTETRAKGVKVPCKFTNPSVSPFDAIKWERRTASITDDKGNIIFEQKDVEVPESWSMLATNIIGSKYLFGAIGTDQREDSLKQLVHRVARTIADWGATDGYFASKNDAENFYNELSHLCINQYGAFNSPVWFNVGLHQEYGHTSNSRSNYTWSEKEGKIIASDDAYSSPQASACFIQSVDDSMEDIMRLAGSEAMLFKYGSGTGTDLSTLRSSREKLSGGGSPSGPLSFMRVFDQVAAVIKSGGKTRRAAKMQSLKVSHPDIVEFVEAKTKEEHKAWALIDQGYDGSFGGEAYESVMFQNANFSVRLSDDFMKAVKDDAIWQTTAVVDGAPIESIKARELLRKIAEGTHVCGDPGVQYDTTINTWHTCKSDGRINASNPCSEYMFLDDSACNLASLNLMKFIDKDGLFDVSGFQHAVRIYIIAQDILVDNAGYPVEQIANNSHKYHPLGLGYANLGALIMRLGYAYDSEEGRSFAGAVTALMSGTAYSVSQEMAVAKTPFARYEENKDDIIDVLKMHRQALSNLDSTHCSSDLLEASHEVWDKVCATVDSTGLRNAQVTVLAPTGTIGFMMDCDTTGVEPDIALVKYKQLAGGGMMKIVNQTLEPALKRLGYSAKQISAIKGFVDEHDTIEGAPGLKEEHLSIFDCAFKPRNGCRFIPYTAHLRMMAAVQPYLSGAISKTVNVPENTDIDEIMQVYIDGWDMGLKAIAIYRDGSKRTQPLTTSQIESAVSKEDMVAEANRKPFRRRMPDTRQSLTHKFEIAGHEGYLTVGAYEDGMPGELFITMAKEGSTVGGIMDAFGTAISLCLQYGVPVNELCHKFAHSRFEPSGFTKNSDIPMAKSIVDYIFRWLNLTFPNGTASFAISNKNAVVELPETATETVSVESVTEKKDDDMTENISKQFEKMMQDAPCCDVCGAITVRNGSCYRCHNCGNSMGCS